MKHPGEQTHTRMVSASTGLPGRVQLSQAAYDCLSPEKQQACEHRRGVAMKGKGLIDTHLANFDPDGLGQRLWRNFRRFEKMTKVGGVYIGCYEYCCWFSCSVFAETKTKKQNKTYLHGAGRFSKYATQTRVSVSGGKKVLFR